MQNRKLNILCLHGYRQSAKRFHEKTGSMRKGCRNFAHFDYLDAPNQIDELIENGRAWWFSEYNQESKTYSYSSEHNHSEPYNFDCSVEKFSSSLHEKQYDGVLAFSQGAAFLAVVAAQNDLLVKNGIRFVIFVAGFKSRQHVNLLASYENQPICIPSLHIYGETDRVIHCERSIRLQHLFKDHECYIHKGGHYVPSLKDVLPLFLSKFLIE
ncbi:hypothetical protein GJ496_011899 [Pomphorhynchus laevis]|nr:hypothetical protein GJ496_011899 [Pomphorhynchus laevis]